MGKNDYRESRVVNYKNKGDSLRQKPRRSFPGLSLPWVAEVHGNRTQLREPHCPTPDLKSGKVLFGVFLGVSEYLMVLLKSQGKAGE